MKKHRVKLKSEAGKKTRNDLSSASDNPGESDEHVDVQPQEAEAEVVVHPVQETAISEPSESYSADESSVCVTDSPLQIRDNNEADEVVEKESDTEPKESRSTGQLQRDLECSKEKEESCDLKENEDLAPAENCVPCDVHIQNIIVEVTDDSDRNSDDNSDALESTDL